MTGTVLESASEALELQHTMDHPASDLQSSAQLIFKSPHPSVNIPATSFFDYVVQQNAPYPEDHPACIDGLTGAVLTRRELTGNALSLGSALRSMHRVGMLPLLRGSTVMVLTPLTPLAVTLLFAVVSFSFPDIQVYSCLYPAHRARLVCEHTLGTATTWRESFRGRSS